MLKWKGIAIDVQVPKTVELKVVQADPGAKGNTAQGRAEKPATLESGAVINVPIFIEEVWPVPPAPLRTPCLLAGTAGAPVPPLRSGDAALPPTHATQPPPPCAAHHMALASRRERRSR